jgi:hypothetical protein
MMTKCKRCGKSDQFRAVEWTLYEASVEPENPGKLVIHTSCHRDNGTEEVVTCRCGAEYNLSDFEEHEYV